MSFDKLILNNHQPNLPSLVYITDKKKSPNPKEIINRLPKSAWVILRDYDLEDREEYLSGLAEHLKNCGIKFLVARDVDLAIKLQADGVHLPEFMLDDLTNIRRKLTKNTFITSALHSEEAIKKANIFMPDAGLLSSVFESSSHPNKNCLGIDEFHRLAKVANFPILALGGITKCNFNLLDKKLVFSIAGIDIFHK